MPTDPRDDRGDLHLHNAARTLQSILNHRDPEHSYIVRVREGDGEDVGENSGAFVDWNPSPAADGGPKGKAS